MQETLTTWGGRLVGVRVNLAKEGMEGCAMEVGCLKVQGHQGSGSGREGGATREA